MTIMENGQRRPTPIGGDWTLATIVQTFGFGQVVHLAGRPGDLYVVLSTVETGGLIAYAVRENHNTWLPREAEVRRVLGERASEVLTRCAIYQRLQAEDNLAREVRERTRADNALRSRAALVRYVRARAISEYRTGDRLCESGTDDFLDKIGADPMETPVFAVTVTLTATFTVEGDYSADDVQRDVSAYAELELGNVSGYEQNRDYSTFDVAVEETSTSSDAALNREITEYEQS